MKLIELAGLSARTLLFSFFLAAICTTAHADPAQPHPAPGCRSPEIPVQASSDDHDSQVERILHQLRAHLDACNCQSARRFARNLIKEQLECGLWSKEDGSSECSLDNGVSYEALMLMIKLEALAGSDPERKSSILKGLDAVVKAQFPIGAWPQITARRSEQPIVDAATYPAGYPRDFHDYERPSTLKDYTRWYTLNDGVHSDMMKLMLEGWRVYQDKRYLDAAIAGGDFLRRAQMPAPQQGWAQQYDYHLQPTWARPHEPPAMVTRESYLAIFSLIELSTTLKSKAYCDAIRGAQTWLKSTLPLEAPQRYRGPRWYELKSNLPMFMAGRESNGKPIFVHQRSEIADEDLRERKKVNNFIADLNESERIIASVCGE